jgi:hypothetical protein
MDLPQAKNVHFRCSQIGDVPPEKAREAVAKAAAVVRGMLGG